jgi:hypothetical protein
VQVRKWTLGRAMFYTYRMSLSRRRVAVVVVAGGSLIAGAALGVFDPHGIAGGAGWSVAVAGVLWGLGTAAQRIARVSLGPGEQLALGMAVWIAVVGVLLAAGLASRGPLLAVAAIGAALALRELAERAVKPSTAPWQLSEGGRVLGGILVIYLAFNLLGTIASRGNPFDDYVGYMAFVKRMLDRGDLIEPFSFRRLSAYGGQTVLHALAALRGDVESADLLDRGIAPPIAVLLVIDLARARKLPLGVTAAIIVFLTFLSDLSINSASAWTGLIGFLAAYNLASDPERPVRASLVLVFAMCAATCTLRQNFLVPAGLFATLVLWFHLRSRARTAPWRAVWAEQRVTVALCIATAIAVLLPYAIAVWRSNGTFLYPIVLGTANPAAPLQPTGATGFDELAAVFSVSLDSEPIRVWWLLAPFMIIARDTRLGKPWPAFAIACALGFGFMIHSFSLSDTSTLWRYGWSYLIALVIAFIAEVTGKLPFADSADRTEPPLRLPGLAVFMVWLAIFAQLVQSRQIPQHRVSQLVDGIKAARTIGSRKTGNAALYRELQSAIPADAAVAVMLDEAYLLDYGRNRIANLDLPGFAAPGSGLPSFLGAARWRSYFASQGIRYVAFVDGSYSTYLYRRRAWATRVFVDTELFRFMGTHIIDAFDSLADLARSSRVLFHRGGMYAIDLGESVGPAPAPVSDLPEQIRQDRYLRQLSETEFHSTAWQLVSRSDLVFQVDGNGPSPVQMAALDRLDPEIDQALGGLFGAPRLLPSPPPPHRWLSDRTHLRVHGTGRHRLTMQLQVDATRLATFPSAELSLDGHELARAIPDRDGAIAFDVQVACVGWCDVYLVFSTVAEYWIPAEALRAIRLVELDWTSGSP